MSVKLHAIIDHAEENSTQLDRVKALLNAAEGWIEQYNETGNAILLLHVATDIVCRMRDSHSEVINGLYEIGGIMK